MKVSCPFLVRLDNLDVQIPRVLIIFLKMDMGAHKYPPKVGYGGFSCKIQYQIFEFHAISLDEMVIDAKTLFFSKSWTVFEIKPLGPRGCMHKPLHHL